MALTFSGARQFLTKNQGVIWHGRQKASKAWSFRYELAGGVGSKDLDGNYIETRGMGSYYLYTMASDLPGMMSIRVNVQSIKPTGGVGLASRIAYLKPGTAYHFALTFDQGEQVLWVNGDPFKFGSLVGPTNPTSPWPITFGVVTVKSGAALVYTQGFDATWNDYVLTAQDIWDLRDGKRTPDQIGDPALGRWYWTFDGPIGTTAALGDRGLANAFGDPDYDLKYATGGEVATYSAPLRFAPEVDARAFVTAGGKSIGLEFLAISDGSLTIPTKENFRPSISINGATLGELVNPWLTGQHRSAKYDLPAGVVVGPKDVVRISAPIGWATTPLGITSGMEGVAVENRVGLSTVNTHRLKKTRGVGYNNAHLGVPMFGVYQAPKNWLFRCEAWKGILTVDSRGKPLTGRSRISGLIYEGTENTGFDHTVVNPVGYWAHCWDDTGDSEKDPTICGMSTDSPGLITIEECPEYANPGIKGKGQVRLFRVTELTQVAGVSPNNTSRLWATIDNKNGKFNFDNYVIYGPGDFELGKPTVVDRSDRYALSTHYEGWLKDGPPRHMRYVDSTFGYAGISQATQPEHVFEEEDFSWGFWHGKVDESPVWKTARPWTPTEDSFFYTTLFGGPYPAVMTLDLPDVETNLVRIKDASTIPIMAGQRIKIGDELVRVLEVDGEWITIERGACDTVPTAHAAGPVEVQNRWKPETISGYWCELVSDQPHGLHGPNQYTAFGAWPVFRYTDGKEFLQNPSQLNGVPLTNYAPVSVPTGPNSMAVWLLGGPTDKVVTLDRTYVLSETCRYRAQWPDAPGFPVAFTAKTTSRFPGCDHHLNIPHGASDSLVRKIVKKALANLAGRKLLIEYSNEPWNYYFKNFQFLSQLSKWLFPEGQGWEWYVRRLCEIKRIAKEVAGDRADDVLTLINNNKGDSAGVALRLEMAWKLGEPIDLVSIAAYVRWSTDPVSQYAYWSSDDEQVIDQYSLDLITSMSGYPVICAAMNKVIKDYNDRRGQSAKLYGYEGGICIGAPVLSTSLQGGIDATSKTVAVKDWLDASNIPHSLETAVPVGTPLRCDDEWLAVESIAGNVATVTRGAFGSTAVAHANGRTVRTAYLERGRDVCYNPNWWHAEQDFNGMIQEAGFIGFCKYSLAIGLADWSADFGLLHHPWQEVGPGVDNALTLACPGKLNSKPPTVRQDWHCASVRRQADVDWNREAMIGSAKYVFAPRGITFQDGGWAGAVQPPAMPTEVAIIYHGANGEPTVDVADTVDTGFNVIEAGDVAWSQVVRWADTQGEKE